MLGGSPVGILPKPCSKLPAGISNGIKTNQKPRLCRAVEAYAAAFPLGLRLGSLTWVTGFQCRLSVSRWLGGARFGW